MSSIKFYVANATGDFSKQYLRKIQATYKAAEELITNRLNGDKIDVIFVNAPGSVIPEIGVGGYAPGPHNIYVSLDPKRTDWAANSIILTIAHEAHHCMRWRDPGYGSRLGEEIVSEGLATLFEEEVSGKPPIYAKVKITQREIAEAKAHLKEKSGAADHRRWFFGGDDIQRWFGYTWGYQLCKAYSQATGKAASELISIKAALVLPS